MKKLSLFLALLFCLTAFSTASPLTEPLGRSAAANAADILLLPASLEELGEEAFEGTAVKSVIFPDSTSVIRDRAFAGNCVLRSVYIPKSVVHIGDRAFEESSSLTIHGSEGSYAAAWARSHNVAFSRVEPISLWIIKLGKLLRAVSVCALSLSCLCSGVLFPRRRRADIWEKSMRPQDRPELYPIDYRFP